MMYMVWGVPIRKKKVCACVCCRMRAGYSPSLRSAHFWIGLRGGFYIGQEYMIVTIFQVRASKHVISLLA